MNTSETDISMTPLIYLVWCQKYVSSYTCRAIAMPFALLKCSSALLKRHLGRIKPLSFPHTAAYPGLPEHILQNNILFSEGAGIHKCFLLCPSFCLTSPPRCFRFCGSQIMLLVFLHSRKARDFENGHVTVP